MKTSIRPVTAALVALAIVASACAVASETSDRNPDDPQVVGVCAPESPDCEDTLVVDRGDSPSDDGPSDGESPDGTIIPGPSGVLVGGGLTIPEALATEATGVLAVQGFYLDDGTGPRLCEALAESYPPQCGGASVPLGDLTRTDPGVLRDAGGVVWSDDSIVVLGELIDGVLVPAPNSI